jgi:putative tryptophan/tyrosine transport system substrate-binding protein
MKGRPGAPSRARARARAKGGEVLALLRAGRPAPGRAPPRAIDYSFRLNLFKAPRAIQSVCGSRRALRRRQYDRLLLTPGRDIVFEYKRADNLEAMPQVVEELVRSGVDILLTLGGSTLAAAKVTKTVPIVMIGNSDVVETGLVASLARPGGNVTGLAVNAAELAAKRVQLLSDAVPGLSRVAVLWNANLKGMALQFQNIEQASPQLGVILQSVRVTGSDDFDQAFAALESSHPQGLVVLYGPMRGNDLPRIVEFVTQHKLPTIFEPERGVRAGGLMEFGAKLKPMSRRAAAYVDKIANGADPATLPVEEPTLFELVINLQAAQQIGMQIPNSLLLLADRVIE